VIKDSLFNSVILKVKLIGTRKSNERKYKMDNKFLYRASIYITNHKRNIKKGMELSSIECCSCINRHDESCSCAGRLDES
jgi:hypothetical protein